MVHNNYFQRKMCSASKDEYFAILGVKDNNITLKHVSSCFTLTYVYIILTETYHFKTETDWKRLKFAKMIKGKTLNWIDGMILFNVNSGSYKSSIDDSSTSNTVFIIIGILCLMLVIACCLYCFKWKKRKQRSRSYRSSKSILRSSRSSSKKSKQSKLSKRSHNSRKSRKSSKCSKSSKNSKNSKSKLRSSKKR